MSAALLRPNLAAISLPFQIYPNLKSGSDAFISEIYQDRIEKTLSKFSDALLRSPSELAVLSDVLDVSFAGESLTASETKLSRASSSLAIYRSTYSETSRRLSRDGFLDNLQQYFSGFTHIETAEFQVIRIEGSPDSLRTEIRFDFVGSGSGYHREQRCGYWSLAWHDYRITQWRAIAQTRSRSHSPCFTDISDFVFAKAPSFRSQLSHGVDYWRTVIDSASGIDIYGHNGVSVGDIDGDGFDDLYICQPAGLPNRLFRNRRDGTFEDITERSGVGLLDNTACALFADFNNKGTQDLVVVRATGPILYVNEGNGTFRHKPNAFRFATDPQGTFTGAAVADYNGDGMLDIYFCLYSFYRGYGQYKYPVPYYDAENGPPNFLMRNNGDGSFRDVTLESGLNHNNNRYSFCCGWGDLDNDGLPDLYVVNDFGRKNLYRNNGDGTFTDIAAQAKAEDIGAGMSVSWFDFDNDGNQDLYVANMWTAAGLRMTSQDAFGKTSSQQSRNLNRKHAMGNSLMRNTGQGAFKQVTDSAAVGMGRWSWSSDAFDFDHDGYQDLYVTNGMISGPIREDLSSFFWRQVVANSPDRPATNTAYNQGWNAINDLIRSDYAWSGYERNVLYKNHGDGTFSDVSGSVGLDFLEDGRSFALADFDHDGRQEMFLKNRNAPQVRVLKNVIAELPASISFSLVGSGKSNRDAIGAAVTIESSIGRQTRFLQAGSGFFSQHSKDVFFGLGDSKGPINATVKWPSGLTQNFGGLPSNNRIFLTESLPSPSRMEPFRSLSSHPTLTRSQSESLPQTVETWLLDPIPAPISNELRGKTRVMLLSEDDQIHSLIYRYMFDRHRSITAPTSLLIDADGYIVKVYQGPVDSLTTERDMRDIPRSREARLAKCLPFPGVADSFEFERNYLTLGGVFFQHALFAQAELLFAIAVQRDSASAEAHYGLGSSYLKLGKTELARTSFEQAVAAKAAYPDTLSNAWNNLGLLATQTGRIESAISCFESALRENPDYTIALLNLGNAYRQQKNWDKALSTLRQLLTLSPDEPEANYSLAMVYAQTDNSEKAYQYFRRALQYRPAYPEALNNLGILYLRTRHRDEAVNTFEECIRVAPQFNQSYLNLAQVYVVEGDTSKARAILNELLKQNPGDLQAQKAFQRLP